MRFDFQSHGEIDMHRLSEIALLCLAGESSASTASEVCSRLARQLHETHSNVWDFSQLAETLFKLHPIIALDNLVASTRSKIYRPLSRYFSISNSSPLDLVPAETLLKWADRNGVGRYPKLACEIRLVETREGEPVSISELAIQIFDRAPDRAHILEIFSSRLIPSGWSGSLADVLAPYVVMTRQLQQHSDRQLSDWAVAQEKRLRSRIEQERILDRRSDESFE